MPVDHRFWISVLAIALFGAWWASRDDAEAEVRNAHAELARLLNKAEPVGGGAALLSARALQTLFAETCEISTDEGASVTTYSPEEIARLVVGLQARFETVEVVFGDPEIQLTESDVAETRFSANLTAFNVLDANPLVESMTITSRMSNAEGSWMFTHFTLDETRDEGSNVGRNEADLERE